MSSLSRAARRSRGAVVALGIVIVAGSAALGQDDASGGSVRYRQASAFLERLQRGLDSDDRRGVAAMFHYPVNVLAGLTIPVKDASALVTIYNSVFTPELRCAIVRSEISQSGGPRSAHAATVTADGLVFGDGHVWAALKDGRFGISRVTVPPAAASVTGRKGVTRVSFVDTRGERTAGFAGWLIRRNTDTYLVSVKRGETLDASIQGFRGRDATIRVAQEPGSSPTPDRGRKWSVVAPADAEYRIEVAYLAPYCDPAQRYRLSVAIH